MLNFALVHSLPVINCLSCTCSQLQFIPLILFYGVLLFISFYCHIVQLFWVICEAVSDFMLDYFCAVDCFFVVDFVCFCLCFFLGIVIIIIFRMH